MPTRVAIATLRERTALWEFIDARDRCERALRRAGHQVVRYNTRTTYLAMGRNMVVSEFLRDADEPEYLWFLDSDVTPPVSAGLRLLEAEKDIVSGLYVKKIAPHLPEAYRWEGTAFVSLASEMLVRLRGARVGLLPGLVGATPQLMLVDGVGAGCLMLHRRVVEVLGAGCFGPTESGMGEDLWFCRGAQASGFEIYLDFGLLCGHLDVLPVGMWHFLHASASSHSDGSSSIVWPGGN